MNGESEKIRDEFPEVFCDNFLSKLEKICSLKDITKEMYDYGTLAKMFYNKQNRSIPEHKDVISDFTGFVQNYRIPKLRELPVINYDDEYYEELGYPRRIFPNVAEFVYLEKGNPVYLQSYLNEEDLLEKNLHILWVKNDVRVQAEYSACSIFSCREDANKALEASQSEGSGYEEDQFQEIINRSLKLRLSHAVRSVTVHIDRIDLISRVTQEYYGDAYAERYFSSPSSKLILDIGVYYGYGDIQFKDFNNNEKTFSPIHFEFPVDKYSELPLDSFGYYKSLMSMLGDEVIHPHSAIYLNQFRDSKSPAEEFKTNNPYASENDFFKWLQAKNRPKLFMGVMKELYNWEINYQMDRI